MKSRGFFLLLLLFTCACFVWWIVKMNRLSRENLQWQLENQSLLSLQAQNELLWLGVTDSTVQTPLALQLGQSKLYFPDTTLTFLSQRYPELEFSIEEHPYLQAEPKEVIYRMARENRSRARYFQLTESAVFFILLLTGFIWIYRSLSRALEINLQQNQFLVSVTHELKTPISSMRLIFQTLLQRQLDPEKQHALYKAGITDNNRLLNLVETLLLATRMDSHELCLHLRRDNFSEWLSELLDTVCRESHGTLEITRNIVPDISLCFDPVTMANSIRNLLDNARKYAGNSDISVHLFTRGHYIFLNVIDLGPGIADAHKKKIFLKFYRVNDALTSKSNGTGLGLYIVAETIRRHGGTIKAEDAIPYGTKFSIKLPMS